MIPDAINPVLLYHFRLVLGEPEWYRSEPGRMWGPGIRDARVRGAPILEKWFDHYLNVYLKYICLWMIYMFIEWMFVWNIYVYIYDIFDVWIYIYDVWIYIYIYICIYTFLHIPGKRGCNHQPQQAATHNPQPPVCSCWPAPLGAAPCRRASDPRWHAPVNSVYNCVQTHSKPCMYIYVYVYM